jgi:hypothetical protein
MRPNRQQTFRTDAAGKLDQLELVAALLERDATNNRAFINEINSANSRQATGRPHNRLLRLRAIARGTQSAAVWVVSTTLAIARSRQVRAANLAVYAFAVDFAVVLSVVSAAVIILAAAFLLTAPPV